MWPMFVWFKDARIFGFTLEAGEVIRIRASFPTSELRES